MLGSTLSIAKLALSAQQYGLEVTGNNISNVNNPNYSVQRADQTTVLPQEKYGLMFGLGVSTEQISQSVDAYLEKNITSEETTLSAYNEIGSYMKVLEDLFSEEEGVGISSLLATYWNSWEELSNDPESLVARQNLYDNSVNLCERINFMSSEISDLQDEITEKVIGTVQQVNSITKQIAKLNKEIKRAEVTTNANDYRDKRTGLLKELSGLIDINYFELTDGTVSVMTQKGAALVNRDTSYNLHLKEKTIMRESSSGQLEEISDVISKGKLGAWIDMRDCTLEKYQRNLNVLSEELTWATNYTHSYGTGLNYFSDSVEGTYQSSLDDKLSALFFGDRIDYTKDFSMWVKDNTTDVATKYTMDMDISTVNLGTISGTNTSKSKKIYEMIVTDAGEIKDQYKVTASQLNNTILGQGFSSSSIGDALNTKAFASQTVSIKYENGTIQKVNIPDGNNKISNSAKSICEALTKVSGVTAKAASNSLKIEFPITTSLGSDFSIGDEAKFTLSSGYLSDGITQITTEVSYAKGATDAETKTNFKNAMENAIETLNNKGADLTFEYDTNITNITLTSASGNNIGVQDFTHTNNVSGKIGIPSATNNVAYGSSWYGQSDVSFNIKYGDTTKNVYVQSIPKLEGTTTEADINKYIATEIASSLGMGNNDTEITLTGGSGNLKITKNDDNTFSFVGTNGIAVDISDLSSSAQLQLQGQDAGTIWDGGGSSTTATSLTSSSGVAKFRTTSTATDNVKLKVDSSTDLATGTTDSYVKIASISEIKVDPQMTLSSNIAGTGTGKGLFNVAADTAVNLDHSPTVEGGKIYWESFNADGSFSGDSGVIDITGAGTYSFDGLSFNVEEGKLTAGNVLSLRTDTQGNIRNFDIENITGKANSVSDTYEFEILSDGTIGKDAISIRWSNSFESKTVTLDYDKDEPLEHAFVEIDGMKFKFDNIEVFKGEGFIVKSDENGNASKEFDSNWHWTLESFNTQFNNILSKAGEEKVTAYKTTNGEVGFKAASSQYSFAFGDDNNGGLLAALGINTFFEGEKANALKVNDTLSDLEKIAAAILDSSGKYGEGNGENAVKMSDLQSQTMKTQEWEMSRGSRSRSFSTSNEYTLNSLYLSITGDIGLEGESIQNSISFQELLVKKLGEQRDSISAVSLDEEMINLTKYQHAWTAASKLLNVVDEMLQTLVNMR